MGIDLFCKKNNLQGWMKMKRLATRQVHLDFHTTERIGNIGKNFSKDNFQKALKIGNLNSITLFAKCHHSWCYFPTQAGNMHPNLDFDLLGAQIEAAHEIGVRTPIYITVAWSANDAINHPEWLSKDKDGKELTINYDVNAGEEDLKPAVSWKFLCPSGAYAQHIYDLTEEICKRYHPVDGIFYDICYNVFRGECYCDNCRADMKKRGMDIGDPAQVNAHIHLVWEEFSEKCNAIIKKYHADASVFYNGGASMYRPKWHEYQTHFEMEDLPTTWGGYDKMPPRAKYFARTGKDYLGMTGKFHTNWGEFGGFKNPLALRYECASMLAYGARCSVGDQVHPDGEMDLETYRIIGSAYDYVKTIEPYCFDVTETSKLGIIVSPLKGTQWNGQWMEQATEGLIKMLMETQLDFDIVMDDDVLSKFDTIILHDNVLLEQEMADKLNAFVAGGGSLVLTGYSGLDVTKSKFMIDVGATYIGESEFDLDYVHPGLELAKNTVNTKFLFYSSALKIQPQDGAAVLGDVYEPFFNRRYGHYCSHQNTPYQTKPAAHPAGVAKGKVIYLAHGLCQMYHKYGSQYHRDYFISALKMVYTNPVLSIHKNFSAMRTRFVDQKANARYILHLLYAQPSQRGIASVIEDLPEIYHIDVTVKSEKPIKAVYLAPQKESIGFTQNGQDVHIKVEKMSCHQMVVFEY